MDRLSRIAGAAADSIYRAGDVRIVVGALKMHPEFRQLGLPLVADENQPFLR